jgi:hypothetical protein
MEAERCAIGLTHVEYVGATKANDTRRFDFTVACILLGNPFGHRREDQDVLLAFANEAPKLAPGAKPAT